MAVISLRSVASARDICSPAGSWIQPPRPIAAPRAVYPGQAFDPLYDFIQPYRKAAPEVRLHLGYIEDATFIVKAGFDGLILNNVGAAVRETSYYTEVYWKGLESIDLKFDEPIIDAGSGGDIFISFDGAWIIYYHWLFFCLGSAGIAQKILPTATLIATPNWEACAPTRQSGISCEVFDEVRRVVDPTRFLSLSDGAYRARRAYFLYVEGGQPSDAVLHSMYHNVFRGLRSRKTQLHPSRIFITRRGRGGPARVTESDEKIFEDVLIDYDIKKLYLENMTFQSQIDHFSNASLIISPHGSSLANLVFAPQTARVIELQTEMDWPGSLRPWFYLLAAVSNLRYAFLNREAGDFQAERLREGLRSLDVSRPTFSRASKTWRILRQRMDSVLVRLRRSALIRIRALWSRVFRAD